jgi:hypothetical protein
VEFVLSPKALVRRLQVLYGTECEPSPLDVSIWISEEPFQLHLSLLQPSLHSPGTISNPFPDCMSCITENTVLSPESKARLLGFQVHLCYSISCAFLHKLLTLSVLFLQLEKKLG